MKPLRWRCDATRMTSGVSLGAVPNATLALMGECFGRNWPSRERRWGTNCFVVDLESTGRKDFTFFLRMYYVFCTLDVHFEQDANKRLIDVIF